VGSRNEFDMNRYTVFTNVMQKGFGLVGILIVAGIIAGIGAFVLKSVSSGRNPFVPNEDTGREQRFERFFIARDQRVFSYVQEYLKNLDNSCLSYGFYNDVKRLVPDYDQDSYNQDLAEFEGSEIGSSAFGISGYCLEYQGTSAVSNTRCSKVEITYDLIKQRDYALGNSVSEPNPLTLDGGFEYTLEKECKKLNQVYKDPPKVEKTEVHVLTPNGGEIWEKGGVYPIRWKVSSSASTVYIQLLNVEAIGNYEGGYAESLEATPNDGEYIYPSYDGDDHAQLLWQYTPPGRYIIRISPYRDKKNYDESDKPFMIVERMGTINLEADKGYGQPPLQVTFSALLNKFPSCGNTFHWIYGDGYDEKINEPCGGTPTDIPLRTITKSHMYQNDGKFTAKLLVGNYTSNAITIRPDTPTSAKQIIIHEPKSGEKIKRGQTFSIGWLGYAEPPFNINLLKDGSLFQKIIDDYYSYGRFTWNVPTTIPAGSDYKIEITSGVYTGVSDGEFTIE